MDETNPLNLLRRYAESLLTYANLLKQDLSNPSSSNLGGSSTSNSEKQKGNIDNIEKELNDIAMSEHNNTIKNDLDGIKTRLYETVENDKIDPLEKQLKQIISVIDTKNLSQETTSNVVKAAQENVAKSILSKQKDSAAIGQENQVANNPITFDSTVTIKDVNDVDKIKRVVGNATVTDVEQNKGGRKSRRKRKAIKSKKIKKSNSRKNSRRRSRRV